MTKRYGNLVIGVLALLFLGLIYAWSIFLKPLEVYFSWVREDTSHIFTLSMTMFCLGGLCGGLLIRKRSASFILRIAAVLMLLGFGLSSQVQALWQIYITYGIFCGFGVGLAYNAILSTLVRWFTDKPAFCSGFLLMGFGSGGLILGTLTQNVIKSMGWSSAFLMVGVLGSVVLAIASFFVVNPPDSLKIPKPTIPQTTGAELKPSEMIRTSSFWFLFVWAMLVSACGVSVIGQGSPLASAVGSVSNTFSAEKIASTAALAVGTLSVFNGLGRILQGFTYDKVKRKAMMAFICLSFICAAGAIFLALSTGSLPLVFIGFSLTGLSFGSIPAFGVSIIREYFGPKNYSVNMSLFNLHLILASIIGSSLGGQIVSSSLGYLPLAFLMLGLAAFGLLIIPFVKKMTAKATS